MSTYLDYNATTPIKPSVKTAILSAMDVLGNPSSSHAGGRQARSIVENARSAIARQFGAPTRNVLFTSGGTEAIHTALPGLGPTHFLTSAIEHDATYSAIPQAEKVRVLRNGQLDLEDLDRAVQSMEKPFLFTTLLINNETGVIQPIPEIARRVHAAGGLLHVDGVQAGGRVPFTLTELGADAVSLSAHKMGGPKGAGALLWREGLSLSPRQPGFQENRLRGGTENVIGIAGFGAAVETLPDDLAHQPQLARWRDALESRICALCPDAVVLGKDSPRAGNTLNITMPGVASDMQVMALDMAGVAVSAGAACSSGVARRSHVAEAMGYGEAVSGCVLRISFGWASRAEDVDVAFNAWAGLWQKKQGKAA